jgi:hypothetical protein
MGLDINFVRIKTVEENLAYFRKVNFLVGFFENYFDKEIENCENFKITKKSVEELKTRCEKVLANHKLAEELLPTREGFFFGSLNYDEYYFEDVAQVLDTCKEVLLPEFEDLEDDEHIAFCIWY